MLLLFFVQLNERIPKSLRDGVSLTKKELKPYLSKLIEILSSITLKRISAFGFKLYYVVAI